MSSILVIGEALIDVVHHPDGSTREHPGGSPLNVAVGLARLGHHTHLLSHIGDDERGSHLLDHLETSGVAVVPGTVDTCTTSTAHARLADDGSATYDFDVRWELPANASHVAAMPATPAAVHTGSIGSWLEPGASSVAQIVQRYRAASTTTFDPNLRPGLIADPPAVRRLIDAFIKDCDVVKLSDEDAEWLCPEGDHEGLMADWLGRGPSVVILTRGAEGLLARTRHERVEVPAPKVQVVDTVGAGDSVMGALLDGLAAQGLLGAGARDALRAINAADLQTLLEHAAQVGAITVSRAGANPPWRSEVLGVQEPHRSAVPKARD